MRKVVVAMTFLLLVVVAGAAGSFAWLRAGVRRARGPADAPKVVFEVPKGATGQSLGQKLVDEGLIESALFWRVYLREHGGLQAKAGKHVVSAGMTVEQIGTALESKPVTDDVPFAMIEGWRLRDTDAALAAKGWIKPGAYIAAAKDVARFKAPFPLPARGLEGYLYPETYAVSLESGFDPVALIQRQLDTFVERFWKPHQPDLSQSGRSLDEVVVMASMLEREEPDPGLRPLVAGILWKRIEIKSPLGVDATSRYELDDWNNREEFLKHLRNPDDAYNTRTRIGLPPGPIGSPTVSSLLAAMKPQKSEFLYYLHDANRRLHPSRNAAEHEALRAKYNVY